jgi:hypothetical protein
MEAANTTITNSPPREQSRWSHAMLVNLFLKFDVQLCKQAAKTRRAK